VRSATERREDLKELLTTARGCTRCAELAATRTSVVFGAGNADAELMFVGEAPGRNEDLQGLPFVGAAGKLLETLLGEIGLSRAEVFIANVLKCRPPGNRDPRPGEIENCTPYLISQIELVAPRVICTLGNFATKLLRSDPAGITRVHGQVEVRTIGSHTTRLVPIYHPAAALYTPRTMEALREDFRGLPGVLALPAPGPSGPPGPGAPATPEPDTPTPATRDGDSEAPPTRGGEPGVPPTRGGEPEAPAPIAVTAPVPEQLGLF
jgi:DNA polymerase